jgi:chemotaxis protein MotB
MSTPTEDVAAHEIIVVRRRHAHGDDGHHGGAWKIAYADFMTAMMAFFLVMWLVNSTDQKTIVQVAAYFNPIQLTDKTAASKGLHDSREKSTDKGEKGAKSDADAEKESKKDQKKAAAREQELLADPGKSIAEIASKMSPMGPIANGSIPQAVKVGAGADAVRSIRDPFEPPFRRAADGASHVDVLGRASVIDAVAEASSRSGTEQSLKSGVLLSAPANGDAEGQRLKQAIEALSSTNAGALGPLVSAERTAEGLLISITDQARFGMFALASAEPTPELVDLLRQIGAMLSSTTGAIVVRGHTDGRPFRTIAYDNWRLSSARGYMTYHMLLRGRVDEQRFERVEGHADRSPKNDRDRLAAENRRIEILLRLPKP